MPWSGADLGAYQTGARDHRPELTERGLPGQIFHPAVRSELESLRRDERQGGPNAVGHDLGRLDFWVGQVEDAEDHRLLAQLPQHPELEPGLRGLDRDLLDDAVVQLAQKWVPIRLIGRDV